MILDQYLNYLQEEDLDEKLALIKKLKKFAVDPLAKKAHKTALTKHRKSRKNFRHPAHKMAISNIKRKTKKGSLSRKVELKLLKKSKVADQLRKTAKELKKAKKTMKWRKRGATTIGLGAVGGGGVYYSKRADEKGQSL